MLNAVKRGWNGLQSFERYGLSTSITKAIAAVINSLQCFLYIGKMALTVLVQGNVFASFEQF
ncbi:hypothetical protein D3C71_2134530 [compost metagenome]